MRVLRWGGSLGLSKGPSVITRALIKETQKSQSQRLEDGSKERERERGGGGGRGYISAFEDGGNSHKARNGGDL